jgi:hypothetical protein
MPSVRTPRKPGPATCLHPWRAPGQLAKPRPLFRPLQISTRRRHSSWRRAPPSCDGSNRGPAFASHVKAHDPDQCAHAIVCDGGGVSRGCNATSKTPSTRVNLPIRKCGPRLAHLPPKPRRIGGIWGERTRRPPAQILSRIGREASHGRGEESRLSPSQRTGLQQRRDSSRIPRWLKTRYPQPR